MAANFSSTGSDTFPTGHILQVLSDTETSITISLSTTQTFVDISGNLNIAITPASTSNKILITASLCIGSAQQGEHGMWRFFRVGGSSAGALSISDSTGNAVETTTGAQFYDTPSLDMNGTDSRTQSYLDSPSSTSELTYKVQWYTRSAVTYLNRPHTMSANDEHAAGTSSMQVMEIQG